MPRLAHDTAAACSDGTRTLVRELWGLGAPAVAHMLLVTVVFAAQRLIVGRYDATSLASLQISTVLVWTLYSLCGALGVGALAFVARAVGAGERERAARGTRMVLGIALGAGLLVAAVLALGRHTFAAALSPGAEAGVLAEAEGYLAIAAPAMPLAFLEATAAACLQGSGDTRSPLYAALAGNVVGLVLTVLLVRGHAGLPELGVRGAAIGAVAAFAVEAVWLCAVLASPGGLLAGRRRAGERGSSRGAEICELSPPDPRALERVPAATGGRRELARLTWPALGEKLAYHAGDLVFVSFVALGGATAMASNQALLSVEAACFLTAEGLGVAAAALVAQKLGASRSRQATRAGWLAAGMAALALSLGSVAFAVAPHALLAVFSDDPAVQSLGADSLLVAAIAQPFMGFATVLGMAVRGAGATRSALAGTIVCAVGVRLLASWVFAVALGMGLPGIWLGTTIDWITRSLYFGFVWWRRPWRQATQTTEPPPSARLLPASARV